jgi:rhamnosyltransferase
MVAEGQKHMLAGCIILYNPDTAICSNMETYLPFLDVLYIIDNTETANQVLIKTIKDLSPKIIYQQQETNIGIASALNVAANLAVNAGYKSLLSMDQDSFFLNGEFFDTWRGEIENDSKVGITAASYTLGYDRWQKEYSVNYNEIHYAVTSGNVINLYAWKHVEGFEDKLFIDEVDHDYCLKLSKYGYKILTSKKILMRHMVGEFHQKKTGKFILHSPLRYYYMARNVLYVCKKYCFDDFNFAAGRFYYLLKMLAKIILRYPDKANYLKYFFAGVADFLGSKYGKYTK